MSKIIFITYRVLEKVFKIRAESYIGFVIFYLHAVVFGIKKNKIHQFIKDKRLLWGELRFDNSKKNHKEQIIYQMAKAISYGKISFENSMESAIRGINLLIIYDRNYENKHPLYISVYLKLVKLNITLCPDLYLKRKGFLFYDQSNNHRFYNLLFLQYYNFYFSKKVDTKKIENFVNQRLIDDHFFDEGSSFYHFGVFDSLINFNQLLLSNNFKSFSNLFLKNLNKIKKTNHVFKKLNFGDRDGTQVNKPAVKKNQILINDTNDLINNLKFFLTFKKEKYVFLRKENWTNFGTEGHVHDDLGNFLISNGEKFIYDIGTYKYFDEPNYCEASYHNFPYIEQLGKLEFKSKFVRLPYKQVDIYEKNDEISLTKKNKYIDLKRIFNKNNLDVQDIIIANSNVKVKIEWTFYISENCNPIIYSSKKENKIKISEFCIFNFHKNANHLISNSFYFPDYGLKEKCKKIKIILNDNFKKNTEYKIFKLEPLFKI